MTFDNPNGTNEYEPIGVGVFWPAFIVFAYALGLFIAMVT